MNPDRLAKLESALAPERIDAYRQDGADPVLTMARYLLNMALCESLYSPLQIAELAKTLDRYTRITQGDPQSMATTLEIDQKRSDARSELRDGPRQRGFLPKRHDPFDQPGTNSKYYGMSQVIFPSQLQT